MKVCWLSNRPSPYKTRLFEELNKSIELTIVLNDEDEGNRNKEWIIENPSFKVFKIGKGYYSLINTLAKECDVLIDSMYASKYGLLAVNAFKKRKKTVFMQADGGLINDFGFFINNAMKFLMRRHDYFMSSGYSTNDYLIHNGVDKDKIYTYHFTSLSEEDIRNNKEAIKKKDEYRKELMIDDKFTIINVGRPIAVKGFNILLDSYVQTGLTDKINLYIVGGEPQEEIKQFVEDNKLTNVHFVGLLSTKELNKYYAASDITIFTSRGDVWGLVVNEAMSFGLPVISSNRNGAGLHFAKVTDSVMLCDLEDRQAYANKIIELYNDRNKLNDLSLKALETIKDYTLEKSAEDIIRILNRV